MAALRNALTKRVSHRNSLVVLRCAMVGAVAGTASVAAGWPRLLAAAGVPTVRPADGDTFTLFDLPRHPAAL